MLGLTAFYNPHPAGSGSDQTRTGYWCDYLRDATLQKFTADAVGSYVQRASAAQVKAIEQLGLQFQSSISRLTSTISSGLSEISDRLGALEQSQKATNMLLGNVAQLLRIPDSEKQRQLHIEMGLKFLSNAKHDDDLFKDALDEFKKAEELRPQDFFVLQKIGMIHLYVPSLISLSSAADYLTRSGKYAAVESHADSVRSPQPLAKDPKQDFSEQPDSQPQENAVIGAESYIAASRAQYALGNHSQAFELAQKAVKLQPFMPAALLQQGKCAAATNHPALAADSLRTAIPLRPGVGVLAAGDLDLMAVPEVTTILGELPNLIKYDLPFDSKEIEHLRQLPKAAVLQKMWHIIAKSGACVTDQWKPLVQAIKEEKFTYDEILIFTKNASSASKFIFPIVIWGGNSSGQCDVPRNLTGVIAIAAGYSHTVALKQDGTVAAWGDNSSGQCDVPRNLTEVIAIAVGAFTTIALIFQQQDRMASDLALRFFKLGCALVAAADGQLSSKEQHWLELHLGEGSDTEIISLITQHGPDGIQQELLEIAANLSPAEKSWLHYGAWQFGDLAGVDSLADEENTAIAFILNACGWYQLPEWLQAKLWEA